MESQTQWGLVIGEEEVTVPSHTAVTQDRDPLLPTTRGTKQSSTPQLRYGQSQSFTATYSQNNRVHTPTQPETSLPGSRHQVLQAHREGSSSSVLPRSHRCNKDPCDRASQRSRCGSTHANSTQQTKRQRTEPFLRAAVPPLTPSGASCSSRPSRLVTTVKDSNRGTYASSAQVPILQPWEAAAVKLHRELLQHRTKKCEQQDTQNKGKATEPSQRDEFTFADNLILFRLLRRCSQTLESDRFGSVLPAGSLLPKGPAAPPLLVQFFLQTNLLSLASAANDQASFAKAAGMTTASWFLYHGYMRTSPCSRSGSQKHQVRESDLSLSPSLNQLLPCVAVCLAHAGRLSPATAPLWLMALHTELLQRTRSKSPEELATDAAFPHTDARDAGALWWTLGAPVCQTVYALQALGTAVGACENKSEGWRCVSVGCFLTLVEHGMTLALPCSSPHAPLQPSERERHLSQGFLTAAMLVKQHTQWPPTASQDSTTAGLDTALSDGEPPMESHHCGLTAAHQRQWNTLLYTGMQRLSTRRHGALNVVLLLNYLLT